jgi:hypothetical protein
VFQFELLSGVGQGLFGRGLAFGNYLLRFGLGALTGASDNRLGISFGGFQFGRILGKQIIGVSFCHFGLIKRILNAPGPVGHEFRYRFEQQFPEYNTQDENVDYGNKKGNGKIKHCGNLSLCGRMAAR